VKAKPLLTYLVEIRHTIFYTTAVQNIIQVRPQ
jgi:hypothetical protein